MILAIDIGNTNIVVGCIDDQKTYFIERLATVRTKTELEYAVDLKTLLEIYHIKKADIEGCIISSVVPQITNIAKLAAEKILKKEVMVLGPGVKTGLNIMMDNPGQLGADLVADAVAGLNEYPVPFIDRYGNRHYSLGCQQQKAIHWRNDPSWHRNIPGCTDSQSIPAQRDQHRCPEACDRAQYHRMHEKRRALQQRSSHRRDH